MARARRRGRQAAALLAALTGALAPAARADDNARIDAALVAALPADHTTDVVLIEQPSVPDAPRVRAVTYVAATPAAIKDVLLAPAHYHALIPSLIRAELHWPRGRSPTVDWELEIPLFNLSGRMTLRNRPNGVTFEFDEGDFAPGRLIFTVAPSPGGGTTLSVDAVLDVRRSSWILRRIIKRSPAGEPAALAAAVYVTLRAVALRAEHPTDREARRPTAPPRPPAAWAPESRPLGAAAVAPLRGHGHAAGRLAGVAAAVSLKAPVAAVEARLREPSAFRAFPGWKTVRVLHGPNGPGAQVEDDLPLIDCDATWTAVPGPTPRWTVTDGATRGARLGWSVWPRAGGHGTVAVLLLYPRLEATGSIARRFLATEPLLEGGLALALAFADVAGIEAAFASK